MTPETLRAFGDELTKIAFFQRLKDGFTNAVRTGWHGTADAPQTWMGQGLASAGERAQMGRLGKAWDTTTSLGGATKYLPVGGKSMMLLGTGLMAREALRDQDPAGLERSKAERVSGLAANTLGGLAGTGALLGTKWGRKHQVLANLLGGLGGGMAAEKIVTAPFRHKRQNEERRQRARAAMAAAGPHELGVSYPTGGVGRVVEGLGGPA